MAPKVEPDSKRSNRGTVALSDAGVHSSLSNTTVFLTSDFDRGLDLQDINHDGRVRVSELIIADLGFGYDTFGIRKAIMNNDAGSADGDNRPVPMERIIRLLQQVDGGGSDDNSASGGNS